MSADFTCAICEIPSEPDKYRNLISNRIKSLSDSKIKDIASEWWHLIERDYTEIVKSQSLSKEDLYELNNLDAVFLRKAVSNVIRENLDEFVYNNGYWRNDIANVHLNGTCYLITGGMSWGDTPTESYDYLLFLESTKVLSGLEAANLLER